MSFILLIALYILGFIVSAYILYWIIRLAVNHGTKDALKQNEYYLEIIAKYYHDKK